MSDLVQSGAGRKSLWEIEESVQIGKPKTGEGNGAEGRTRTDDLLITNQLLYQLSYFGMLIRLYRCAWIG